VLCQVPVKVALFLLLNFARHFEKISAWLYPDSEVAHSDAPTNDSEELKIEPNLCSSCNNIRRCNCGCCSSCNNIRRCNCGCARVEDAHLYQRIPFLAISTLVVIVFVFVRLYGMGYSSDNVGDGPQESKKRGLYANKAGNKLTKGQKKQLKRQKQNDETSSSRAHSVLDILQKQKTACERKNCNKYFLKYFDGLDDAIREFTALRESNVDLAKTQSDKECLSLFLATHSSHFKNGNNGENWRPDNNAFKIKIKGKSELVCTQTFVEAHGFTMHQWGISSTAARDMSIKEIVNATAKEIELGAKSAKHKPWTDSYIPEKITLAEAKLIFSKNVPDFAKDMPRASITTKGDKDFLCMAWLFRHFETFGDKSPIDDEEIKVNVSHRKDVFNQYRKSLERSDQMVRITRFYEIWDSLFPLCVNRTWCSIPGKCDTCYEIDQLRRTSTSLKVQKALQYAHLLHRGGLFNLERNEYKNRVVEALMDDPKNPQIMSIIIDGMDNNKCQCPYKGTQSQFSKPLPQHIIGVKEHGCGAVFFRTMGTVKKSANLTIHCLLRMVERWQRRNGKFPTKIYLQCDGGAENANKTLLAFLEFLVAKRIAKTILFTRLPTGHTHEVYMSFNHDFFVSLIFCRCLGY
jgi:hypothetical protein